MVNTLSPKVLRSFFLLTSLVPSLIYAIPPPPRISPYGSISRNGNVINIVLDNAPGRPEHYNATISDYNSLSTFVNISGRKHSAIAFGGTNSNTATGFVNIYNRSILELQKTGGATAWSGHINVINGGVLLIYRDHQINDTSNVHLSSNSYGDASILSLIAAYYQSSISEKIHNLTVKNRGTIECENIGGEYTYPPKPTYLYLDNLIVEDHSSLEIRDWVLGRNHLLVRKDSWYLEDALKKIDFIGYKKGTAGKREYNWEYWEIGPGFPEPSTYGAVIAGSAVGLAVFRKRKANPIRYS